LGAARVSNPNRPLAAAAARDQVPAATMGSRTRGGGLLPARLVRGRTAPPRGAAPSSEPPRWAERHVPAGRALPAQEPGRSRCGLPPADVEEPAPGAAPTSHVRPSLPGPGRDRFGAVRRAPGGQRPSRRGPDAPAWGSPHARALDRAVKAGVRAYGRVASERACGGALGQARPPMPCPHLPGLRLRPATPWSALA
jgi:hypothetical protein